MQEHKLSLTKFTPTTLQRGCWAFTHMAARRMRASYRANLGVGYNFHSGGFDGGYSVVVRRGRECVGACMRANA